MIENILLKRLRLYLITSLVVITNLFVGCKKEMAVFSYHPDTNSQTKKIQREEVTPPITAQKSPEATDLQEQPFTPMQISTSANSSLHLSDIPKKTNQDFPFLKKKKKKKDANTRQIDKKKPFSIFQKDPTQTKRKREIKNTFFNDQVKIGGLFLGGAILLSLFNLSSLALLFGLAALLLLFLGLKKYFRKQRRKKSFRLKNK